MFCNKLDGFNDDNDTEFHEPHLFPSACNHYIAAKLFFLIQNHENDRVIPLGYSPYRISLTVSWRPRHVQAPTIPVRVLKLCHMGASV